MRAERALAMLAAQTQLERGNAAAAATALAAAPGKASDDNRSTMLLATQIAMAATGPAGTSPPVAAGSPDDVALRRHAETLQTWVAVHPHDGVVWQALAQVWGRLGQPLRSVRAEAEGRYAIGDLTGAVDRLRAGQRLARSGNSNDFIESSVIDSRLREIDGERMREMAEREKNRG